MNPLDDQLDRLFRAAGKVRPGEAPSPAYGLETRVLAAWKAGQAADPGFWDMTILVRGLMAASLIMVISIWPALKSSGASETTSTPYADFQQLADSTVASDDTP